MANIQLPASLQSAKVDTYTRTVGGELLNVQSFVAVDPFAETSGTLTAAAQTIVAADLGDASGMLVTTSGTFSGTIAFEASADGTNWYAITMTRTSTIAQESTRALTGTTLEAWRVNLAGWVSFRVRCSAYTSGTATIRMKPTSMPFEPPAAAVTATATLAAGSNLAGDVALGVRTTTTNAMSFQKVVSAAGTNATVTKATAGRVYGWNMTNTTASFKFLKLYNKATAPTVGTDIPVQTVAIPPNSNVDLMLNIGVFHSAGIGYAITGAYADADTTAVAAGDVIGSMFFA